MQRKKRLHEIHIQIWAFKILFLTMSKNMYLSLLLEKKLLYFSMPPSMNCSQNFCAQIHLSERKHPVQFGLFILSIFFFFLC